MIKEDVVADPADKDTKQTILNATVELVREEGFKCATLRKIAARADTNLALVNYYFGSKENLLGDAIRTLVSTFDNAFSVLEDDTLTPKERLKQFFIRYIGNLERYPGLARQMLDQGHHIMGSQDEYARYCKLMRLKKIQGALQEITQESNEDKLMTMLLQLYGAVVFPVLVTSFLPKGQDNNTVPICNLPSIEAQIDGLFELYFY
ncbi:MAG: TetR family transcriptional regulator, partial [Gorillibacterium sp.]|nr:TetR family transcriptional regulator [Gorillibacterium sp.]